jgi:lipopolysaccharide export system permease protein
VWGIIIYYIYDIKKLVKIPFMKLVDKYITKEFLRGFFISLVGLLAVYIIVDIFEQISKFVDYNVSTTFIILYYIYQIPWIIGTTLSPIACILGCFLSVGNLSKHFELAAFRFSGMSFYRLCRSPVIIGIVLSIMILGMNEFISPIGCQKKIELERKYLRKRPSHSITIGKEIYYSGENSKFYHIKFIDSRKGIIKGFTIYEFSPDYTLKKRTDAPHGRWRDGKWELFNGTQKIFSPRLFREINFDTLILHLKEKPQDFLRERKKPMAMGFFEFKEYIHKLRCSGEDITKPLVDLYLRISFPFMNLIVILLGFPIASKVRNIGFIIGFGVALFVSFIYWGLMQIAKAFGHAEILSPLFASILPNFAFLMVTLFLIWKFRK